MEYIILFMASVFGVAFHVAFKLIDLGNKFPSITRKEIGITFLKEEWDSLCLSGVIALFMLFIHYVIHNYAQDIVQFKWFELTYIGVSIIMGYQGQRLLYKWLGSAADFLDKKVTDKLQ